jgi:RNA polymerase sigma-70 factor (ECF subfamily)
MSTVLAYTAYPSVGVAERTEGESSVSIPMLTQLARTRLLQFGVSPQDVEDLTQDLVLSLMRQLPTFELGKGSVEGWVTGFAKMSARAWARQNNRKAIREIPLDQAPAASISHNADRTVGAAINTALDKLPAIDRQLVSMRFIDGLSSKQIADATGLTDVAIRKRLSRAIERIRHDGGLREALAL